MQEGRGGPAGTRRTGVQGAFPGAGRRADFSHELERRSFRRRRLVDAACALPFLGLLLWWLPLMWRNPETDVTTAQALVYIFAVWLLLPLGTGLLIWAIRRASAPERPDPSRRETAR